MPLGISPRNVWAVYFEFDGLNAACGFVEEDRGVQDVHGYPLGEMLEEVALTASRSRLVDSPNRRVTGPEIVKLVKHGPIGLRGGPIKLDPKGKDEPVGARSHYEGGRTKRFDRFPGR